VGAAAEQRCIFTKPRAGIDTVERNIAEGATVPFQGLVASHSSDVKSSHFAVEWSRDLDPVATAPRFCR